MYPRSYSRSPWSTEAMSPPRQVHVSFLWVWQDVQQYYLGSTISTANQLLWISTTWTDARHSSVLYPAVDLSRRSSGLDHREHTATMLVFFLLWISLIILQRHELFEGIKLFLLSWYAWTYALLKTVLEAASSSRLGVWISGELLKEWINVIWSYRGL